VSEIGKLELEQDSGAKRHKTSGLTHLMNHLVPCPEEAEVHCENRANDSGHEPLDHLMSRCGSR
ncbi:hypothetical protein HAX54_051936, partial [Datura stramonium]|nr:hypothetical protein [Datura stramonium]